MLTSLKGAELFRFESPMEDTRYLWDLSSVPNYASAPSVAIELANDLDEVSFRHRYIDRNTPCLIKGAVSMWRALKDWSVSEYLINKIGNLEVRASVMPKIEVFGLRPRDRDLEARQMTIQGLLPAQQTRVLLDRLRTPDDDVLFMEVGPNEEAVRCLENDLMVGSGRFSFLPNPPRPQFIYTGWNVMFYKNSYSDWHFHPGTEAIMCQVAGTKDVLLLPPTQTSWDQIVPIHVEQWKVYDVDLGKAPQYSDVQPIRVTVEPGDGLFLPVNWWHAVQGRPREFGVTVPITWNSCYRDLRQPATRHFVSVLWERKKPLAVAAFLSSIYGTVTNWIREQAAH